jgi:hypothetical protein
MLAINTTTDMLGYQGGRCRCRGSGRRRRRRRQRWLQPAR